MGGKGGNARGWGSTELAAAAGAVIGVGRVDGLAAWADQIGLLGVEWLAVSQGVDNDEEDRQSDEQEGEWGKHDHVSCQDHHSSAPESPTVMLPVAKRVGHYKARGRLEHRR